MSATVAPIPAATDSPARARILAAARRRFTSFGYRRTAIADIAREAGVASGTLYRHFRDKEDIFREVIRELHERWLARARGILRGPGTALERLTAHGEASVAFREENSLINSIFRRDDEIVFAPLIDELHDQLLTENVALMTDVLRDGMRAGELRQLDPERTAYVLFMAGDALSNEQSQRHYRYDEVFPTFGDIVLRGLLPRDEAPGPRREES